MRYNLSKFALTATLGFALAFFLSACPDKPDYEMCDGIEYDTTEFSCVDGELVKIEDDSNIGGSSSSRKASSSSQNSSQPACTAENNTDTQYCSDGTMKTYGSTPEIGGRTYKTVVIGEQVWMAENLNYDAEGSKCYDNDQSNCDRYGRLYNWATAMAMDTSCNSTNCSEQVSEKHRGICPSGWHLPSGTDWYVLMKFVEPSCKLIGFFSSSCAGAGKLKANSDLWDSNDKGTDDYGFAALPGGPGIMGHWWSASEYNDNFALHQDIGFIDDNALWAKVKKIVPYSVRCLKD